MAQCVHLHASAFYEPPLLIAGVSCIFHAYWQEMTDIKYNVKYDIEKSGPTRLLLYILKCGSIYGIDKWSSHFPG